MPRARGRALVGLAAALAAGDVALDRGADRDDVRRALVELPGIGPWTADYVAMRALGHPDVFLPTDLGVRNALAGLGHDPAAVDRRQRPLAAVALLRPDAPLEHPHARRPATRRRTDMWTVIDSPIGELRLVERDGAVTADRVLAVPRRRRPPARRARRRRTRCSSRPPASCGVLRPRPQGLRPPAGAGRQRLPAAGLEGAADIGYGETASYGEIAHRLGMTNAASRAVGLANGRNPIPIVIPCHRVIGANGTLTGYAGGLERKQTLLELEQDALF